MRSRFPWLCALCLVVFLGGGCSSKPFTAPPAGTTCPGSAIYRMVSAEGDTVEVFDYYTFHCRDVSTAPDTLYYFRDCPDDPGDHFSFYQGGSFNTIFDARIKKSDHYVQFSGSVQRKFVQGNSNLAIAPLATGYYEKVSLPDSVNLEYGQFEVIEYKLHLQGCICPAHCQ